MPKLPLKSKQKKRMLITVVSFLFFTVFYAQNKIVISYGQKIDLGNIAPDTHFYIKSTTDKIRLKGNKINDYSFSQPGIYQIEVKENAHAEKKCQAVHLPKEILVEVSRVKMVFDRNIVFSSPILKNKDTHGITLRVPVTIETFDHQPATLNTTPVNTAGIGTGIIASPDTNLRQLPEGNHMLQYALSGVVTENSYLMFDFIDPNANIQTIALTTPVKN